MPRSPEETLALTEALLASKREQMPTPVMPPKLPPPTAAERREANRKWAKDRKTMRSTAGSHADHMRNLMRSAEQLRAYFNRKDAGEHGDQFLVVRPRIDDLELYTGLDEDNWPLDLEGRRAKATMEPKRGTWKWVTPKRVWPAGQNYLVHDQHEQPIRDSLRAFENDRTFQSILRELEAQGY